MKEIIMHNRLICKVDDEDFDYLNQFNWTAHKRKTSTIWYAERNVRIDGKSKTLQMHRIVMGNPNKKFLVDHSDRDGLNNQKLNLRLATRSQNNANRQAARTNLTSKYLGVAFEKDRKRWTARIRKDTIGYRLGSFDTEIEAAKAYNEAAIRFHGEFANLNQV